MDQYRLVVAALDRTTERRSDVYREPREPRARRTHGRWSRSRSRNR